MRIARFAADKSMFFLVILDVFGNFGNLLLKSKEVNIWSF